MIRKFRRGPRDLVGALDQRVTRVQQTDIGRSLFGATGNPTNPSAAAEYGLFPNEPMEFCLQFVGRLGLQRNALEPTEFEECVSIDTRQLTRRADRQFFGAVHTECSIQADFPGYTVTRLSQKRFLRDSDCDPRYLTVYLGVSGT